MKPIPFPTTNGTIQIAPMDICYLYPQGGNYCWLVLQEGKKLLVKGTVNDFESILDRPPFIRVHNDYIANQECILHVLNGDNRFTIEMSNYKRIPVSSKYFDHLLD